MFVLKLSGIQSILTNDSLICNGIFIICDYFSTSRISLLFHTLRRIIKKNIYLMKKSPFSGSWYIRTIL